MTAPPSRGCLRWWPASYYFPEGKKWLSSKWVAGTLLVDYKGVSFCQQPDKDRKEGVVRTIPFSAMTRVRKATFSLVYSALVISAKDKTHWFSGLPNREAAFTIIDHFWHERLLPSVGRGSRGPSWLGADLLGEAVDSERTLQAAGTQLRRQGQQLQLAAANMLDLHHDLSVAEKFISSFESWVGHWRLPQASYTNEPIHIIDLRSVPTLYDFPVLYAAQSDGADSTPKAGTLRVSPDGLTIMDMDMGSVYHYSRTGMSAIRVSSPWEMTVSKYLIGQPDMSYVLLSTHLVNVLKVLQPLYEDYIDLVEPPPGMQPGSSPFPTPSSSMDYSDDGSISPPVHTRKLTTAIDLVVSGRDPAGPGAAGKQAQTQADRAEVVTEEEAAELTEIVARMKNMALDINNEQAAQLETINTLSGTVVGATDRLKRDTKRIKQLF